MLSKPATVSLMILSVLGRLQMTIVTRRQMHRLKAMQQPRIVSDLPVIGCRPCRSALNTSSSSRHVPCLMPLRISLSLPCLVSSSSSQTEASQRPMHNGRTVHRFQIRRTFIARAKGGVWTLFAKLALRPPIEGTHRWQWKKANPGATRSPLGAGASSSKEWQVCRVLLGAPPLVTTWDRC